jgi:hypothetical protein|uniref:Uncharacterized protein n=1 Tax=viral metagenome TaxID=1070528 RepID=A0A6C0D7V8_9ZZZZ
MTKTRKNNKNKKILTMCKSRYALCTSAPCKKIPNKPGKTICKCVVEKGYNFATKSCKKLKPHGTKRIYSTFSINEMKRDGKRITECSKKYEWSDCLNHKCVVDPKNAKKAICECTLRKTNKDWFTMGANNNHKQCSKSKWSGAHKKDFHATRKFWNGFFKKKHVDEQIIDSPNKIINKLHNKQ